jgi:hypothetical protein
MRAGIVRGFCERSDDVLRRPDLGIPAAEIDDRLALGRRRSGDASEQHAEVLLGQALEPVRPWPHGSATA